MLSLPQTVNSHLWGFKTRPHLEKGKIHSDVTWRALMQFIKQISHLFFRQASGSSALRMSKTKQNKNSQTLTLALKE